MSRVEDRERILAEAMAQAAAHEAHYHEAPDDGQVRARWKSPLALLVFAVAGVVAVFPPAWVVGAPPPSIQADEAERGLRAAMYLQAMQVEVFRLRSGRLPDDLSELPASFPELRLLKSNSRVYQLLGRLPNGRSLVYDSANPEPAFAATAAGWGAEGQP